MIKISDILAHKGSDVLTIGEGATVFEAIQEMVKKNVGAIVILNMEGQVRGIFTERDYLRRIVLKDRHSKTTPVVEVMSDHLIFTDPERSVEECMTIMTNKRIRHIPVLRDGQLAGIVSIGDLVKNLCEERGDAVKNLTDYITGQYPGEIGFHHRF